MKAKTTAEMQEDFDKEEACFGKLYDGKSKDCKACSDGAQCDAWQKAGGDPAKKNLTDVAKSVGKGKNIKSEKADTADKKETTTPTVTKDTVIPAAKKGEKSTSVAAKSIAAKKDSPTKNMEKDAHGFVASSKNSKIYSMLVEGKHTKEQIELATDSVGKTTVNLFISDVQKPVGKYPSSRGVKVVKSDKGILSIGK